jgi:NADPH:quinone reductase-like Zn-dependent oxidoreductase
MCSVCILLVSYLDEKSILTSISGTDVAGEVYEVGSDVKNFKKGDRVLA